MPSVMPTRALAALGAALCLVTTGCAAGQLNQQQKELAVSDAGYAARNGISLQAVFLRGPVVAGSPAVGHFVAVNSNIVAGGTAAAAADELMSVTVDDIGPATLVDGTGKTVPSVVVPGGQSTGAVTAFTVPQAANPLRVGGLFTATFDWKIAGAITVTGTVVAEAPGAYSDDTQEQRGQCLSLIGPNGQGGSQLEQLEKDETATPEPEPGCETTAAPQPTQGFDTLESASPSSAPSAPASTSPAATPTQSLR